MKHLCDSGSKTIDIRLKGGIRQGLQPDKGLPGELVLLPYKKEFQKHEIVLISYVREVWCLKSDVQRLNCTKAPN